MPRQALEKLYVLNHYYCFIDSNRSVGAFGQGISCITQLVAQFTVETIV